MKRIILYICGLALFFLTSLPSSAETVTIKGVYPESKEISDNDSFEICWEASQEGNYTISISSTVYTRLEIDEYKDVYYPAQSSECIYIYPITHISNEGVTIDDTYYVNVELNTGGSIDTASTAFILDNPPEPPSNVSASPGDSYVTVNWTKHRDEDIKEFSIYYSTSPFPNSNSSSKTIEGRSATSGDISGLQNGSTYYFTVQAVDVYNNKSQFSNQVSATPELELGFENFSDEDIGCIIGRNAGYKSVFAKRAHRVKNFLGSKGLINNIYYSISVLFLISEKVNYYPSKLGELTLFSLIFLIVNTAFHISPLFLMGFLVLLWIGLIYFPFPPTLGGSKKRKFSFLQNYYIKILPLLFFFSIIFPSSFTYAQSPQNFYLDIKAGNMDFNRMGGNAQELWDRIYGKGGHTVIEGEFGYELPWKKIGITRFSLTGGIFWERGYGQILSDNGQYVSGGKDLYYYIFPIIISLGYHFKYFKTQYIVPFAKAGVSFYPFLERKKNAGEVDKGTVYGYCYSFGALIELNWIEPHYARSLDIEYGINATYLMVEYRISRVNTFGKWSDHNFSNNLLLFGLAFEF